VQKLLPPAKEYPFPRAARRRSSSKDAALGGRRRPGRSSVSRPSHLSQVPQLFLKPPAAPEVLRIPLARPWMSTIAMPRSRWARTPGSHNTCLRYYRFLTYDRNLLCSIHKNTEQHRIGAYELLRIPVPRTWVNKLRKDSPGSTLFAAKVRGQSALWPRRCARHAKPPRSARQARPALSCAPPRRSLPRRAWRRSARTRRSSPRNRRASRSP
jgi:hypothetical protein